MAELTFFGVLSSCAVALLGLMFVAISIELGRREWKISEIEKSVVHETLLEFMLPLIFSLAFVSWPQYWKYSGCGLGILGILATSRTLFKWKKAKKTKWEKFQMKLSIFSFCFYGIFIGLNWFGLLSVVKFFLIWLLISGTMESWRILVAGTEDN